MALLLATSTSLWAPLAMSRSLSAFALPWISQDGRVSSLPIPLSLRPEASPSPLYTLRPSHRAGSLLNFLNWGLMTFSVINSSVFMGSLNISLSGFSLKYYLWIKKKKKSSFLGQALPKNTEYYCKRLDCFNPWLPCSRVVHLHPSPCSLALYCHRTMGQWEEFTSPQTPLCWQLAWPMECCGNGMNRSFVYAYMVWLAFLHPCDSHKKSMALLASIPSVWAQNETQKADPNLICHLDLN